MSDSNIDPLRSVLNFFTTMAGPAGLLVELPSRMLKTGADEAINLAIDHTGQRAAAIVPTDPNDSRFREEVFEDNRGWKPEVSTSSSIARSKIGSEDRIYAESRFVIKTPPGMDSTTLMNHIVNQLRQPWSFYNGKVTNWKQLPDGRITYDLYPIGFGLSVFETMGRPLRTRDGHIRIPIVLQRDAHGLAYIELIPGRGRVDMRGRFAGVQPGGMGNMFGAPGYATNHLEGENGRATRIPLLGALLHDGGGLAGLIRQNGWSTIDPRTLGKVAG
jgi:hypothetical protein